MQPGDASYTTSDLSRRSGDIIAEALRRPVTITQRNKPRLVILNIEDYEKLLKRSDTRLVGTIETMPDWTCPEKVESDCLAMLPA